ncbi:SprT family zinc-dependent metalloprotease [soil metagenome]
MPTEILLGDISVDVVFKDIQNVHLSVHPPTGRVRIAAPSRMDTDTIRAFAISRLDWIRRQQRDLRDQPRETPREYLDRESHYLWGRRYLLKVLEANAAPKVELEHRWMLLIVRPDAAEAARQEVLARWYRDQIRAAMPGLLARWEPVLGVKAEKFFVQQMKTRWGSCNAINRTIRLNTELAKKPPECLEYVVVHELVHLLEPTHNARFVALMESFMPEWHFRRQVLNQLPVRHETWGY